VTAAPESFFIDEKLYLEFCRMTFRRSISQCVKSAALAILVTMAVLALVLQDLPAILAGAIAGLIALTIFLVLRYLLLPRRARKVYLETVSLREARQLSVDEVAFTLSQESGTWRSKWVDMVKWDETSDLIAIYPNRVMAQVLAKGQLSDGIINYCRDQLIEAGLPQRGKRRK
jgi:hypothetical protein